MIIQPTSVAALTWIGAAAGASAEGWRIGSVLPATPLGVSEQGLMVLQIGALAVEAEAPGGKLPPQFQVRVLSLGPQPQLEILPGNHSEFDSSINQTLRERLPQQNGYAPLLATVGALSQYAVAKQLPPDVRSALALLEHNLATPQEIGSELGLRQAIQRSGLFLEAQLAQAPTAEAAPASDDLKGALVRLSALLKTQVLPGDTFKDGLEIDPPLLQRGAQPQARVALPPELLDPRAAADLLPRLSTDVHAALARLELTQLQANPLHWLVEVPVQNTDGADVVQFEFKREADSEQHWSLGFALDLPALGPIAGEIHLRALRLSVRLWAQSPHTVDLLEAQFENLRTRVSQTGLVLDQLSCHQGMPQSGGGMSAVFLKAIV